MSGRAQEAAQRRVVRAPRFVDSFRAVECPHARWLVQELTARLIEHPYEAPVEKGNNFRVLYTKEYGRFPALRLFYRFDDEALYLLDVDLYDQLL